LIGQLVRVASAHMILSETEHFLTKAAPTRDQLERLDSLLKSLGQKDAFRRAMICERAMGVDLFGSPQLGQQLASLGDAQEREMGWSLVAALTSASGLKDADQRYHLEHLERLLAHSPPDRLARIEAIGETSGEVHAAVRAFPPKILSGMLLPALGTAASKLAETDALRDCALISLAIERHRLAGTGAPPAKLSELALEPPVDPFDGRPLRYVRRDSGYVVYSVGRDRIDNGGKERPRTGNRDSYDVTFTVER
jgi:hypothetical protein